MQILAKHGPTVQRPCAVPRTARRSRVLARNCKASSAVLSTSATQPTTQWRTADDLASQAQQVTSGPAATHNCWAPAPAPARRQQHTANVLVDFSIQYASTLGQELCICGSAPELGGWDVTQAVPLAWLSDNTWRTVLTLEVSTRGVTSVEYKYIVRDAATGDVIRWQDGENRCLKATYSSRSSGHYEVVDSWDGTTHTQHECQHHGQVVARSNQSAQPCSQQLSAERGRSSSRGRGSSRGANSRDSSSSCDRDGSSSSGVAVRNNITCLPPGWRTKASELEIIHLGAALQLHAIAPPLPDHLSPKPTQAAAEAPHFWAPGLSGPAQTPTDAAAASLSSHDGDAHLGSSYSGRSSSSSSSVDEGMLGLARRTLTPSEMADAVGRRTTGMGAVLCAATHRRMCHVLAMGGDAGARPLGNTASAAAAVAAAATAATAAPTLGAVPADAVAAAASMANAAAADAAAAAASVTDAASADAASAAALVGVAAAVELRRELLDPSHERVLAADREIARASRQLCSMMADDGGLIA